MQHLTKDEVLSLLAAAKAHSERDWLMILVSFWHGLRASEVVGKKGIAGNQIQGGYITVQRLKGSMETTQKLIVHPDPLLNEREPLEALAASSGKGQLFPIGRQHFWTLMKKYGAAAGIVNYGSKNRSHPHILKHSIAMQTIKSAGIENVRQYLGHVSMSSTGAYLKVSDDEASEAIALAAGV